MKESERTLLFALAELRRGNCAWDAFQAAIKAAYADQQPAAPKPSAGVSAEAHEAACEAAFGKTWTGTDAREIWQALHAAAPILTASKDAEIAAVIRDNDAKMVEIDRLKELNSAATKWNLALADELRALRHPDIEAAAKRAQKVAAIQDECARVIARAILTREPG